MTQTNMKYKKKIVSAKNTFFLYTFVGTVWLFLLFIMQEFIFEHFSTSICEGFSPTHQKNMYMQIKSFLYHKKLLKGLIKYWKKGRTKNDNVSFLSIKIVLCNQYTFFF